MLLYIKAILYLCTKFQTSAQGGTKIHATRYKDTRNIQITQQSKTKLIKYEIANSN